MTTSRYGRTSASAPNWCAPNSAATVLVSASVTPAAIPPPTPRVSARRRGDIRAARAPPVTAATTWANAAMPSRPGLAVASPPDGRATDKKTTSPANVASAASHSIGRIRRWSAHAARARANRRLLARTGSITTRRPRSSAAAWRERLTATSARPVSQSGCRRSLSRTALSNAASDLSLAATRCWTTLATAKVPAAVAANATASGCALVPLMRQRNSRPCRTSSRSDRRAATDSAQPGPKWAPISADLSRSGRYVRIRQRPMAEAGSKFTLEPQRLVVIALEQSDKQGQQQEVVTAEAEQGDIVMRGERFAFGFGKGQPRAALHLGKVQDDVDRKST